MLPRGNTTFSWRRKCFYFCEEWKGTVLVRNCRKLEIAFPDLLSLLARRLRDELRWVVNTPPPIPHLCSTSWPLWLPSVTSLGARPQQFRHVSLYCCETPRRCSWARNLQDQMTSSLSPRANGLCLMSSKNLASWRKNGISDLLECLYLPGHWPVHWHGLSLSPSISSWYNIPNSSLEVSITFLWEKPFIWLCGTVTKSVCMWGWGASNTSSK